MLVKGFANQKFFKKQKLASVGKDVERLECLYTVLGDVKWYKHYGKLYGNSSKKLKLERPYDPTIPLQCIYPTELISGS